jgi:small subunit ribosomal protein S21
MKKYNRKKQKNGLEEYDRRLDKKRKKYGKKINAQDCIEPYQVYVRENQVERAYKILERMLKKDRIMETYRERLHYKKPSEQKNEKNIRVKRKQQKENKRRKQQESLDDRR